MLSDVLAVQLKSIDVAPAYELVRFVAGLGGGEAAVNQL